VFLSEVFYKSNEHPRRYDRPQPLLCLYLNISIAFIANIITDVSRSQPYTIETTRNLIDILIEGNCKAESSYDI
jgi:hypothetical protein